MRYFLIILLGLSFLSVRAQVNLQTFLDVGENNVSEGVFTKQVFRGSYQIQKFSIEGGVQFDWKSNNPNTFTGLDVIGSREFLIKKFSFDVIGFFMLNRFSDLAHETNWGIKLETRKFKHFTLGLGTNFKSYKINSDTQDTYNYSHSESKLSEDFNLLYLVSAYIKPHYHHWNVGLSITNIDYYIINQSTNPVFNLQALYCPHPKLTLFLESWYKQAGVFNISANHFGYFFRGGIKWEI